MNLKDYGRNHSRLLLTGVDVSKAKGTLSIFDLQQGFPWSLCITCVTSKTSY